MLRETEVERGERMGGRERWVFFLFLDFLEDFPEDLRFLVWMVSFTRVRGLLYWWGGGTDSGERWRYTMEDRARGVWELGEQWAAITARPADYYGMDRCESTHWLQPASCGHAPLDTAGSRKAIECTQGVNTL